jgi:VanZ family protein
MTSRWMPAVLMMVAIFFFSSIPSEEMPELGSWDTLIKKGGHMMGYTLLAMATWRGVFRRTKEAMILVGLIVIGYAICDEFHQSFVPGRKATWVDVLLDSVGACVGLFMIVRSSRIRHFLLWKVQPRD